MGSATQLIKSGGAPVSPTFCNLLHVRRQHEMKKQVLRGDHTKFLHGLRMLTRDLFAAANPLV